MRVLFVCTGNICRSAMAEALGRMMAEDAQIEFSSAGTHAMVGYDATPEAIRAVTEVGARLVGHHPRQLDADLANDADVVLCMTRDHLAAVRRIAPAANASLMKTDGGEVDDPYYRGLAYYRLIRDEIAASLTARIPEWVNR